MKYQEIHGWFNWEEVYSDWVSNHDEAIFVEVGVWLGRSLLYMYEQARNKRIAIHAVDTWAGCEKGQNEIIDSLEDRSIFDIFCRNMKDAGFSPNIHRKTSLEASRSFPDQSVDFVFIDADHKYSAVKQDISIWLPKVKPGGLIAGHDIITWPSVREAVRDTLPNYTIKGDCWLWNVPA